MVDDVVEQRGIQKRGGIECFAGDGCADDGEDAGADDGSYTERG